MHRGVFGLGRTKALEQRRDRPLNGEEPEGEIDERLEFFDLRFEVRQPRVRVPGAV